VCRSQASQTENSEVVQIAYEVAEQFPQLHTGERMEEYNDTRRWRCYPVDASVLKYYRASPKGSLQNCVLRSDRKFFLGKEKKLKHFSFSIKRNLYSSCSLDPLFDSVTVVSTDRDEKQCLYFFLYVFFIYPEELFQGSLSFH
jgi:hypothetical protein